MTRKEIIEQIQALRGSKILTYVTSDRQGPINARIAMDVVPIFSNFLRIMGKTDKIDLFLYSAGGDTMVPWRLVSMIREYCDTFSVLVPYKAHSSATMISLGADSILMSDLSELSPIDPSTANVFNPIDPQNPQSRIPISVEDVMAYFDLVKNKFGIKNDHELAFIFNKFIEASPQIHPLALGNINRTHNLIRMLAKRLLKSHKSPMKEEEIEKIIDFLTEKLYSHQYFIGRKEAKDDLGLKTVVYTDSATTGLITNLYDEYKKEMELEKPWNPEGELGASQAQIRKDHKLAFVESENGALFFNTSIEYKKQQISVLQQTPQGPISLPQEQIATKVLEQGWKTLTL